jgi:hypothetical protein
MGVALMSSTGGRWGWAWRGRQDVLARLRVGGAERGGGGSRRFENGERSGNRCEERGGGAMTRACGGRFDSCWLLEQVISPASEIIEWDKDFVRVKVTNIQINIKNVHGKFEGKRNFYLDQKVDMYSPWQ